MPSRRSGVVVFLLLLALAGTAEATYSADRPLNDTYHSDVTGGYLFDMGTSAYKGSIGGGMTYNATYSIDLPPDARVLFQRVYLYWSWSRWDQKAVYPDFQLRDSRRPGADLAHVGRTVDSKGFVSNYDFYSGMDAYETVALQPGHNEFALDCLQAGQPNSSVAIFGIGVFAVYESKEGKRMRVWVKEGSDLMYSSYGVSPEMATNEMLFRGPIPEGSISSAELFLVAPSGGYSRDVLVDLNKLMVNRLDEEKTPPLIKSIFSLLFPNYMGKEWSDIFSLDDATQMGFEKKEIRPYLRTEDNSVSVQDRGEYMQLTNAILTITYTGDSR